MPLPDDEATIAVKLGETHGCISEAAAHFGVTRQALWHYVQQRPALKSACEDARESALDRIERRLEEMAEGGHYPSVKYYLDTHGAARGYGDAAVQARLDAMQRQIHALLMQLGARQGMNGEDGNGHGGAAQATGGDGGAAKGGRGRAGNGTGNGHH